MSQVTWHEVARPQIHGYDMQFIVSLSNQQFVSASDEKVSMEFSVTFSTDVVDRLFSSFQVIRVFEAPQPFCDNYLNITGQDFERVRIPSFKW